MYDVAAFRESRRNGDATSRLTQLLHSTLLFDRFDVVTWTPIVNDVSGPARICHLRRVMNLLDDEGLTASLQLKQRSASWILVRTLHHHKILDASTRTSSRFTVILRSTTFDL